MLLQVGVIRLAILASVEGPKALTLFLPPPERGGLNLEFVKKGNTEEVLDGGERTRTLGYLPVLTCDWSAGYDETDGYGYAPGVNDGQSPGLEDLLQILSLPTGMLRVSPGLSAGGFTVDSVAVKPIGRKGLAYTGLQAVFRGRRTQSTMTLEAF